MPRRRPAAQLDREIVAVLGRDPGARRLGRDYRNQWSGSAVQSLLFARPPWTPRKAKAWAREHDYRSGKVHATKNYLRLRQFDPVPGTQKRTITFGDGIRAVIEQVK